MQFLYKIQPTRPAMLADGPTAAEEIILSEHFAYLKRLTGQGVVILAGRTLTTDDQSFGLVIFEADDEAAAQQIMNDDPAVINGVMQATLFPYRVALIRKDATN